MQAEYEKWYRYNDDCYGYIDEYEESSGYRVHINLQVFVCVRTTPKGVWLIPEYDLWSWENGQRDYLSKRFVLRAARKKYACPSIEEAKISFLRRKEKQVEILTARLERARRALALGNRELAPLSPIPFAPELLPRTLSTPVPLPEGYLAQM